MLYVLLPIVVMVLAVGLWEYNGFMKLRNEVKEAFSTMDVYLKKRWDLIPNLVEVVKNYAKYESNLLEEVTKFRSRVYDNLSSSEKIETNNQIANDLPRIMAIAENYPDLKANENFKNLAQELIQVENEIANSRKYYNAVVKKLNTRVEMFPNNIFAKLFGIKEEKMFMVDGNERENIKIEM